MFPLNLGPERDLQKSFVFENTQALFTNEFGRTASFTVRLNKVPDSDVTIGPITSSNTKEGILITNSTLTFTKADFDQPQTITVEGIADGLADGNKQFAIQLGTVQTKDYSYSLLALQDVFVINTDKETPSIAASPVLGLSTNENGQTANISIVLSTQPGADVVISGFSSDNPTECTVSGSLTFTSNNWDTPQTLVVTGINDSFLDGSQNCLITSTPSTSVDQVYLNKTMPVVTVVNIDDDSAGFTFIPITTAVTTEGSGQSQFSIVMNTTPTGTVTITGITTSDTTEGTVSPANLTFTAADWNTPRVMVVTGVDDFMQDGDITYQITFPNLVNALADAAYNNLSIPSHSSFTNQDNDTRGVVITALAPTTSLTPLTVTEGGIAQTFQVRLSSAPCDNPGTPTSCNTTSITINLTNSNTSQYTISPSSLTFSPANWNINQTVTVNAVNDSIDDGDLNFTLSIDTIVNTTDYNGINPSDIAILVVDNDTAGFTISPSGGITVNENDPGGVGLETTITVVLNSEPTGNVTLGSILSSDTLEAIVAPTIGGGNVSITNRTLVFTPTAGQAIVNSDSNSDTINDTSTGGWNVPQTIRIRAVVDGTLDGTKVRTISFGSRTTSDTLYANTGTTPTPNVQVTNEDSGIPSILLQSISGTSFAEDGTSTITLQVALATLPTGNVTISNIVSSDTTEGVILPNGGGSPIVNRTLVFTPTTNAAVTGTNTTTGGWNMAQTITIRSVTDSFNDGDIPFKITFTTPTGAVEYIGLFPTSINSAYNVATGELTLTNTDDDTKGITVTATNPVIATESGTNGTFTVSLNSDPCSTPGNLANCASSAVTINLTNNNTSQYTISPSSLTFAAGTWNSPQTVTVIAVNDSYDEINSMNFVLSLDTIVSTTDYAGLNPSDVNIRIDDDDSIGINLTLAAGYSHVTSSTGGFTEYSLSLASSPAPGNTVTVTVSVPTAAPQEGKILASDNTTQLDTRNFIFTSANWSTNQTFRVAGITGSGVGNMDFTLTRASAETGTLPPTGFTVGNYNNYNSLTANQTITNYHIGGTKKIRLAGATTTLLEASPTATFFWVMLNQAPVADLTINFGIDSSYPCTLPATVGSTKQFTVDTASIVLTTENWNQITDTNRIQITSVNDLVDDGDVACPIIITSITSAGTDPYYTGSTSGEYTLPTIIVTDNDARGIQNQNITPLVGTDLITSRYGASGTIEYSLTSQPMTDVTLTFSDLGGNASYSPATLTFTPANYSSWQTVTVTGNAAGAASDNNYVITATAGTTETATGFGNSGIYNNTLTNTHNAINKEILYNLVSCTSTVITSCIAVNGSGGTVAATYTTTETGVQRFFAISLRARPTSDVTISVSSSDTTEGTVSPGTLTFTSANWDTLQVVTITGVDDFVADGNIGYNIIFGAMAGNAAFTTTIGSLAVTNTDNDTVGFVLTPANETGIPEINGTSSFTIRLNSEPTDTVTIPLSVNTPTAPDTGLNITSSTTLIFTTANWNTPQTVTVEWTADPFTSPATRDHSVILGTATSTDGNYAIDPPDYTISITNL